MELNPARIEHPTLLFVEGVDERGLFGALLRHMGIPNVQLLPVGGKTFLAEALSVWRMAPGFASVRSIGVVRDADTNPRAAFESVAGALRRAGLPVPDHPMEAAVGPPRVTVMILPSASRSGALEDLCLEAVAGDRASPCLDRYFDCLKDVGLEGPRNISRARMQVFLASRSEAGKRLGEAAQAGYLPWDAPAFAELRTFLQTVSR